MDGTDYTVTEYSLDPDRVQSTTAGLDFDDEAGQFEINSLHLQYLSVIADGEEMEFDQPKAIRDENGDEYGRVNAIVYRNLPEGPQFSVELYKGNTWHEPLDELITAIRDGDLSFE